MPHTEDTRQTPYCNMTEHCPSHEKREEMLIAHATAIASITGSHKTVTWMVGIGLPVFLAMYAYYANSIDKKLTNIDSSVAVIQKTMADTSIDVGQLQIEVKNLRCDVDVLKQRRN